MRVKDIGIFGAVMSLAAFIGLLIALSHSTDKFEPDTTSQFTSSSEPETMNVEITVSCEQTYSEFFGEYEVDTIDIVLVSHMKEATDLVTHLAVYDGDTRVWNGEQLIAHAVPETRILEIVNISPNVITTNSPVCQAEG